MNLATSATTRPMTEPSLPETQQLPDLGEETGDRDSITDVHGTVARFEMAYTPSTGDRFAFGPPLRMRLPSLLYLSVAVIGAAVVLFAYSAASSTSTLFRYVVEGDKHRILASPGFALILVASALGTAIRAHMRGVVVTAEGIEARTLLAFGLPRVRRWAWPQVDRVIVDEDSSVMLELWDGRYERLPEVSDGKRLAQLLEQIAAGRRMQVTRLARAA